MRGKIVVAVCLIILSSFHSVLLSTVNDSRHTTTEPSADQAVSSITDRRQFLTSWVSRESSSPYAFSNNSIITSDQVVINCEFPDLERYPERDIVQTSWSISSGFRLQTDDELTVPLRDYYPYSGAAIIPSEFSWTRVDGIKSGETVNISVDSGLIDSDIMVWWADSDNTTWRYTNNLVSTGMVTPSGHENGSFIADRNGDILIGVYNFAREMGTYTVTVDTLDTTFESVQGNRISKSTWEWQRNRTVDISVWGTTESNVTYYRCITNLTVNNFFAPELESVEVSRNGDIVDISWGFRDRNVNDSHFSRVLISSNEGESYYAILSFENTTQFTWNSSYFVFSENYRIEVQVFDSLGLRDTAGSDTFRAGALPPPDEYLVMEITAPRNRVYFANQTNNKLHWSVWIANNLIVPYQVSIDGVIVQTGMTRTAMLPIVIGELRPGEHNCTLELRGGRSSKSVTITISIVETSKYFLNTAFRLFLVATLFSIVSLSFRSVLNSVDDQTPQHSQHFQ